MRRAEIQVELPRFWRSVPADDTVGAEVAAWTADIRAIAEAAWWAGEKRRRRVAYHRQQLNALGAGRPWAGKANL